MDLDKIDRNESAREQGVRFELGDGAWIKLRHSRAKAVQDVRREAERVLRQKKGYLPDKDLSESELEEVLAETLVRGTIVDFGGMKRSGQDVPFSESAARELISKLSIRDRIVLLASNPAFYEAEHLEAIAGN